MYNTLQKTRGIISVQPEITVPEINPNSDMVDVCIDELDIAYMIRTFKHEFAIADSNPVTDERITASPSFNFTSFQLSSSEEDEDEDEDYDEDEEDEDYDEDEEYDEEDEEDEEE